MTSVLLPGRGDGRSMFPLQPKHQRQDRHDTHDSVAARAARGNDKAGDGRERGVIPAANSRRSVAISDAILAAQATFVNGDFHPEAFARCVCLLLEAFEGGDNAVRLCTARLLERYRPYLGSSIVAVEVARRVAQLLAHDDPTTRELCLDVLALVAFALGGLPRAVLAEVDRSLRSPFPAEQRAAARAYAACISIQRAALSSSGGNKSVSRLLAEPRLLEVPTVEKLAALAAALLPTLDCGPPFLSDEASTGGVGGDASGRVLIGSSFRECDSIARLLDAVLSKIDGDLPSTEAWESIKQYLLYPTHKDGAQRMLTMQMAALDVILSRLRSLPSTGAGVRPGAGTAVLRVIAVDFVVSLISYEGNSSARSVPSSGNASESSSSVQAVGMDGVRCMLDALDSPDSSGAMAGLLSVLGAPALADAVLDAEFAAGGSTSSAAGHSHARSGAASSQPTTWFPLTTAAVGKFREISSSGRALPSSFPSAGTTSVAAADTARTAARAASVTRIQLACASALVSFAAAAFRRSSSYVGGSGDDRGRELSALARHAAQGVLEAPPTLRLLSGEGFDGHHGVYGTGLEASAMFPQLRALAVVHAWPRRRLVVALGEALRALPLDCPMAVDAAVVLSHLFGAGFGEDDRDGVGDDETGPPAFGNGKNSVQRLLWQTLFERRFSVDNPKAAVGIAVALMRLHRGSVGRQATLTAALVRVLEPSTACASTTSAAAASSATSVKGGAGAASPDAEPDDDGAEHHAAQHSVKTEDGNRSPETDTRGSLVEDPWFQLVLCRECMLHGFFEPAEAGLRRLRAASDGTSDLVSVWTEVLLKVSAAEAFYASSTDQVAAYACAAHETVQASELLASLPQSPPPRLDSLAAVGEGANNAVSVLREARGEFAFQRAFLEARGELLHLLGASWGMCQDLSASRNSRYARYTRREGRCRRLPAAYRRLARDFRLLRGRRPGVGRTTKEPLRAASCLCLLLAITAELFLSQGKSVLSTARDTKGSGRKRSWRGWLDRLNTLESENIEGGEGPLMKAVRVLGWKVVELGSSPPAAVGRVAFTSILETVRRIPFPIPRAFFRTGGEPRVALCALPPPPPSIVPDVGDSSGAYADVRHPSSRDSATSPAPPLASEDDAQTASGSHNGFADNADAKRQKRDGGLGARYYGPSCSLRAEITAKNRALHPPLPLMSPTVEGDVVGNVRRDDATSSFSAAETWWAQTLREESLGLGGAASAGGGFGGIAYRSNGMAFPGVWLLQGSVCPGRGRGGALPLVSEVILDIMVQLPVLAERADADMTAVQTSQIVAKPPTEPWTKKVVADIFGAPADASAALCFRAKVAMPALHGARRADVKISLRSRDRRDRVAGTGLVALGNRGGVVGGTSRDEPEIWTIGTISLPLRSSSCGM